ncbi:MAG: hypothetical protein AAF721_39355 [Myxococcota bacterium]
MTVRTAPLLATLCACLSLPACDKSDAPPSPATTPPSAAEPEAPEPLAAEPENDASDPAAEAPALVTVNAAAPIAAGQPAPMFTLPAADGSTVALKDQLANGPVVAVFYRGHW